MLTGDKGCDSFHFRSCNLPPPQSIAALKDIFGRLVSLDLVATADTPIEAEMTVHVMPGLRRTKMVSRLSAELTRGAAQLSDGEDSVCMIIPTGGRLLLSQRGREAVPRLGDGAVLFYREPAVLRFADMTYFAVRVPFAALAALAGDVEAAGGLSIPRDSEAMRLLRGYLGRLPPSIADKQLCRLAAAHVYDLIALALGVGGEAGEIARGRGLRAARWGEIEAALTQDPQLSLQDVARRQGISPRYVQMLFEQAGTSYSAFVLQRRLEVSCGLLQSPRYGGWTITEIALEAGFGDVSYFNRCFKRRYRMTPSDMRRAAQPA